MLKEKRHNVKIHRLAVEGVIMKQNCKTHGEAPCKCRSEDASPSGMPGYRNVDFGAIKLETEGGDNMRDIAELHASEIGEIAWQHKSGNTPEYIAKRLRVKLWQVKNYIKQVSGRCR